MSTVIKVMQSTVHPNAPLGVPDATFDAGEPGDVTITDLLFVGTLFVPLHSLFHYDFRDIPPGTKFTRAKIEMMPTSTLSTAVSMVVNCPGSDGTVDFEVNGQARNHVIPADASVFQKSRMSYKIMSVFTNLSPENDDTPSDYYECHLDGRYGIALKFQQAMSIDASETITHISVQVGHLGPALGTGFFYGNIYRAAGEPGNYYPGVLLATGNNSFGRIPFSEIDAAPGAHLMLIGTAALGVGSFKTTIGDILIAELVFEPDSGASANAGVIVGYDTALSGVTYPRRIVALPGKKLHGFEFADLGPSSVESAESWGQLGGTSLDAVPSVPAFTTGVLQTWGSSSYSPTLILPNFVASLNEAVARCDAEELQGAERWAVVRFLSTTVTILRLRIFASTRNATPTLPGLFGPILTVEYEADQVRNLGISVEPAVGQRGLSVEPAVGHQGIGVSAAVESLGSEVAVAVTNQGVELTPAVETAGRTTVGDEE